MLCMGGDSDDAWKHEKRVVQPNWKLGAFASIHGKIISEVEALKWKQVKSQNIQLHRVQIIQSFLRLRNSTGYLNSVCQGAN